MNETWFPNQIYYVGIGKEILSWEGLGGEKKDLYGKNQKLLSMS